MATMQDVLDEARPAMNDAAKVRYTDVDGLKYANAALSIIYSVRPDLKYGSYGTEFASLLVGDTFPLSVKWIEVVADYVRARWGMQDDEESSAPKAAAYAVLFEKWVVTL